MSPEADVLEMQTWFEQIADFIAPKTTDQARATALQGTFRDSAGKPLFTWNRAYELLKGKARRVDGFEKDNAKRRLAELQRAADEENRNDFQTLEARLSRMEAALERIDPHFHQPTLVALRSAADGRRGPDVSRSAVSAQLTDREEMK